MIKGILRSFLLINIFLFLCVPSLLGQSVNIRDYDQPGSYTYIVPAGISELVIECWGGGGGGSAAIGMLQSNAAPGAGGGGGAHAHDIIKVTPGQVFFLTIGSGGAGGFDPYSLANGTGKNGQDTYIASVAGEHLIVAEGGRGASFAWLNQGGSKGGNGGRYITSKGAVIHTGGRGSDASTSYSGGGGGTGGRTHEGYNAVGIKAGSPGACYCGIAGAGGSGRTTTGDGNPGINVENVSRGVTYAGGGGGGGFDAAWGVKNGGKGANGHIRIKEQQTLGEIRGKTYIEVGQTTQLIPPVSGGKWKSSLVNIATVDETGVVTGLQPGEVVINYIMGGSVNDQTTEIHVFVYPEGQSVGIMGLRSYCTNGSNLINLQASSAASEDVTWFWTGPNNFFWGGSGFTRDPIAANSGVYTVTASRFANGAAGANLITNGSFEQGNVGFQSSYAYSQHNQNGGDYNVNTKPLNWAFSSGSCTDNTSGNGQFMSVMGNGGAGTLWGQTVTVKPNTNYQFSFWVQTMQASDWNITTDIKIQSQIAGVNVGSEFVNTPSKNCTGWYLFICNWNSGNRTSAEIKINLKESMSSHFMVGLDDVSFRPIDTGAFSVITSSVTIDVGTSFTPSVQIVAVPQTLEVGKSNKFIASVQHGGVEPTYVWYLNGQIVESGNNSVYTAFGLKEGDEIKCELKPDRIECIATPGPYISNTVKMLGDNKNYWHGLVSNKWYVLDNWTKVRVPNAGEDIEFATKEKSGVEVQEDLEITGDVVIGNYKNESGKKLVVAPGSSLTVNDQIDTKGENKILIQSAENKPNGSLIIKNAVEAPLATVEMWSRARIVNGNDSKNQIKWQYFGIPVQSITASPTFGGAYVRKYNEAKATTAPGYQWDQLANTSVMSPFLGYEIAQPAPTKYSITGRLVKDDFIQQLTVTPDSYYKGQHILANPYTAAIDISKMTFGEGLEHTVYLYNTGSFEEWGSGMIGSSAAGSFVAIPKEQAQSMGQNEIPSMQGFLVRILDHTKDRTLSFRYADVVKPNTVPLKSADNKVSLSITLGSELYSDKVWLFEEDNCSPDFDNGWDGYKMFSSAIAQLFIIEDDKAYQVSSTNSMDGVYLGVHAGEKDSTYTLHFSGHNLSSRYPNLYFVDLKTGTKIELTANDTQYTFSVAANEKVLNRFIIVSEYNTDETEKGDIRVYASKGILYVDNKNQSSGKLTIYDLSGRQQTPQQTFNGDKLSSIPVSLSPGVYLIKTICDNKQKTTKVILSQY